MRILSEGQNAAFDTEYVFGERWTVAHARIAAVFGDQPFTVLDVGGGNGQWADRLLAECPGVHVTVLEPSELLLSRNTEHPRKTLVRGTTATLPPGPFDLICVHWLLHHLVGDSYRATCWEQAMTVRALREHLSERGRISVFENMYDGWVLRDLPGRLIYAATSSRALGPLTRRLGANTAGVGVAFHSRQWWDDLFRRAGLRIVAYREPDPWVWPLRWWWRAALTLKRISVGHVWLAADPAVRA